ncbi:unnamed protein product [Clonostachys byssicola]|uniref:Uncharacterized protein n=1 Tax=Clonostachys byssicola TaxID=160290 RepID=A0A9N9UJ71_9HYPO|nr:unnamed protein product [Clonostachys byssicola]
MGSCVVLGTRPEGDIIINLVNNDDFSTAEAVEKIVALTADAAAEAFSTQEQFKATNLVQHNVLLQHSTAVAGFIIDCAEQIPHDQQSKLLDFVFQLQKVTVPDPRAGAELRQEDEVFWTGMPRLGLELSEYQGLSRSTEEQLRLYENCVAFVAQLSEIGFGSFKESIGWNHWPLTRMFQETYKPTRSNVRLVCIWLIYAPKKVQQDAQLGRTRGTGPRAKVFKPEYWARWKQFLEDCQSKPSDEIADLDTQNLIGRALDSMEKI